MSAGSGSNTAPTREMGANTLQKLIQQYEEALRHLRRLQRNDSDLGIDAERQRNGLELANGWIMSEAINHRSTSLLEISLKLKLWRLHSDAASPEDMPVKPDEELIQSIHNDILGLMAGEK